LTCEYLREFSKKFETVLMGYSGAGGKLIHKKTRSKKSRDTVPLIEFINKTSWGPSIYTIKITVRGVDLKPLVINK
jgi:hypothetical protein